MVRMFRAFALFMAGFETCDFLHALTAIRAMERGLMKITVIEGSTIEQVTRDLTGNMLWSLTVAVCLIVLAVALGIEPVRQRHG